MARNIHHVLYNHRQSLCPLHSYVYYYCHLLIANNDILQVFIITYQPYQPYQLCQPESESQFEANYFYLCFFRYYYVLSRDILLGVYG